MILPDHRIRTLATEHDMIDPFVDEQVREDVVSYGLSSFGYDMRVAGEFRVFTPNVHNSVVDPKRIDERALVEHEAEALHRWCSSAGRRRMFRTRRSKESTNANTALRFPGWSKA